MNADKLIKYFFAGLVILLTCPLYSQNLSSLESSANKIRKQISLDNAKLDSLHRILNLKVDVINNEKRKQPQDKDKISGLMANSISITNQIEMTQQRLTSQEENLATIEKKLFRLYSNSIDSLSELLNQSKSKPRKEELTAQIFSLRERRLLLTQGELKLSYNPENILGIDTKSFTSLYDKKRVEEYLNNAYDEASTQLNDVTFKINEIEKTLLLQKKATRFLEQAENENELKSTTRISNRTTTNMNNAYGSNDEVADLSEKSALGYNRIISQLAFLEPSLIKSRQDYSYGANKNNFQLKDYKKLLNEVKQLLTEYKFLLSNKINLLK